MNVKSGPQTLPTPSRRWQRLQPLAVSRREPRTPRESGVGAVFPGAMTLSGGRVEACGYSVSIAITQSPGIGRIEVEMKAGKRSH